MLFSLGDSIDIYMCTYIYFEPLETTNRGQINIICCNESSLKSRTYIQLFMQHFYFGVQKYHKLNEMTSFPTFPNICFFYTIPSITAQSLESALTPLFLSCPFFNVSGNCQLYFWRNPEVGNFPLSFSRPSWSKQSLFFTWTITKTF